uniref:piggyBac transposable element-derived protein 4-like isoform X3 n=1 Tax=Styela clava TaxID=7725 RepID=UPI001939BC6B|nr:piggyBac transposable element-derived protein 4-like isoform X3 [Styela clava]
MTDSSEQQISLEADVLEGSSEGLQITYQTEDGQTVTTLASSADAADIVSKAFTTVADGSDANVEYITMTPEEAAAAGVVDAPEEEQQVVTTSLQFDPANPSVLYTADGTPINQADLTPEEQALVQAALQQHLAEQEAEQQLAVMQEGQAAPNDGAAVLEQTPMETETEGNVVTSTSSMQQDEQKSVEPSTSNVQSTDSVLSGAVTTVEVCISRSNMKGNRPQVKLDTEESRPQVELDAEESRPQAELDAEECRPQAEAEKSRLQTELDAEESRQQADLDTEESFLSSILDESDVDDGTFDDDNSDVSTSADEWDSDMESDESSSGEDVSPALTSTPQSKRLKAKKLHDFESQEISSTVEYSRETTPNKRLRRQVDDSQAATPSKRSHLQVRVSLKPEFKWEKVSPKRKIRKFGGAAGVTSRGISASSTPLDCFLQFFTVQVFNLIVEMTNLNAERKLQDINASRTKPIVFEPTTLEEMKAYLGLMIAMGIVKMPVVSMYWQTKYWILNVPSFSKIMPRDRFQDLTKFLHFCDESDARPHDDPMRDRLFKLKPLLNLLEQRLMSVYKPHREISIDESLISFKGRICFREYIKTKRARVGIKVWVLAESKTGYVSRLQIYTGKDPSASSEIGQASRVINDLIAPFENLNHHLYVDNFYTSPDLFASLLERGVYACGTMRPNRKGFPKDLSINDSNKRGFSDWRASGELLAQSWLDNRAVYFLSTIHSPQYPSNYTGRRFVHRKGKRNSASPYVQLKCPPLLKDYNSYMGGVDLADQMRKSHNITRKSKAWYRRVFVYLLEVCIHNARVVSEVARGRRWNGGQFRQELLHELIGDFRMTKRPSRRSVAYAATTRLTLAHHLPKLFDIPRSCVVCTKKKKMGTHVVARPSNSKFMCTECDVHLCVTSTRTCFEDYHRKVEYWR